MVCCAAEYALPTRHANLYSTADQALVYQRPTTLLVKQLGWSRNTLPGWVEVIRNDNFSRLSKSSSESEVSLPPTPQGGGSRQQHLLVLCRFSSEESKLCVFPWSLQLQTNQITATCPFSEKGCTGHHEILYTGWKEGPFL